ncbi:hypothetical protein [Roseobacter sp.]|uniref:hypothetical protein n=1 Tax=Roseobacter sp. TaxID=1907202 RepID=UPI00385E372C
MTTLMKACRSKAKRGPDARAGKITPDEFEDACQIARSIARTLQSDVPMKRRKRAKTLFAHINAISISAASD